MSSDAFIHALNQYPDVLAAAEHCLQQQEHLTDLCIQVQQIPAPTDAEEQRAAWVEAYFRRLGLADVFQDERWNVYARIPGATDKPALMVSAHTDTVFPMETDLTTRVDADSGFLYGPAIGDNSAGVAGLLALAEILPTLEPPPVDVWLVANTGEEGLGDLRGMRGAVDRLEEKIGACIVIEGMGLGRIVHRGLGSRRFRISVTAPGGHSWSDFGAASAVHVLAQMAAEIASIQVPASPRTTLNVGKLVGGTSVNTIAAEAWLELDLRSEEPRALQWLIDQTLQIVQRYRGEPYQQRGVDVQLETIGDRPTGEIPADHPLVQAAHQALIHSGTRASKKLRISSTDANIPLSRGIPAVCVGVTEGGDAHRTSEWIVPALLPRGTKHLLLLSWWSTLWLSGQINDSAEK